MWSITMASKRTQHSRTNLPVQRWCFLYTGGQTYLFKGGVFCTQQNLVRLWQKAVLILREHVHVGHCNQHFICSRSNSSCHQHFLCNEANVSHCDQCFICNRSNVHHCDQHFLCNGSNIHQCNQHFLCERTECTSL